MPLINAHIANLVYDALSNVPSTRDSDEQLVKLIWSTELKASGRLPLVFTTANRVIRLVQEGELTGWDTISRARRKAQQCLPHLRGKLWEKRHAFAKEVHNDMKSTALLDEI